MSDDERRDDTGKEPSVTEGAPAAADAATKVLASTATASFANACEYAAIAAQDMREEALALESLGRVAPATTAMLTEATRSGVTQELPYHLREAAVHTADDQALDAEPQAPEPEPAGTRFPHTRRFALIGACAVAVLAVVLAVVWLATSSFAEPDAAAVERVLAADADIMDGFASNDYVEPSAYELSDVVMTSCEAAEDGSYIVDASATIANESFESDFTATLKFSRASEKDRYPELEHAAADSSGWAGAVLQANADTEAISGVTVDPSFPTGFDPAFDAAAQTCSFTAEDTYEFWFGDNTVSTPYTYAFDGSAWVRTEGEAASTVTYDTDMLQGEYASLDGDASDMLSFRISHLDVGSASFTVEYRAMTPGFASTDITGIIECTLSRTEPVDALRSYRQTDGFVYAFSGDGTSSGGEGGAHIEGALGLDGTIVISFTGDYTHAPLFFGQPSDEMMEIAGTLVRQ